MHFALNIARSRGKRSPPSRMAHITQTRLIDSMLVHSPSKAACHGAVRLYLPAVFQNSVLCS